MSLLLTPQKMTFDHHEKVKNVKLTNTTFKDGQTRPIMFKIKTNKIDLVDAKPSCGYISGKPGHNEINVAIRWLNNTGDTSAKLQILYVENNRITQEMVERNYTHFDNDEYNQNYQAIKSEKQTDAKTLIFHVARKVHQQHLAPREPEPNPKSEIFVSGRHSALNPQSSNSVKHSFNLVESEGSIGDNQSANVSLSKCLIFVLAALLVGLLAGFSLGKGQLRQGSALSEIKTEELKNVAQSVTPEKVESSENVHDSTPETTTQENNVSGSSTGDLSEFVGEQEETNQNTPSTEADQPNSAPQTNPSKQEILANTVEQTL